MALARVSRNAKLDTRSARAKNLARRKSAYWHPISPGFALGYRKQPKGGVWLAKLVIPGSVRKEQTLGPADDLLEPDGEHILSFAQAQRKAAEWKAQVEASVDAPQRPITVREAIDRYEADLKARAGDVGNIGRLRSHLTHELLGKPVSALSWSELRKWRDKLSRQTNKGRSTPTLSPATVNRTCTVFKAVLNQVAADPDQRITNKQAWQGGLEALRDAETARNVILRDGSRADDEWWMVRQIVRAAYGDNTEWGLLIETATQTGARCSQLRRLEVADLLADGAEPRLMMPSSSKGKKGIRKAPRYPVPIPADLAQRLKVPIHGRPPNALLFTKPVSGNWTGGPWQRTDHQRPFDALIERCGLADWERLGFPAKVTMYALRHSSIVRQLLDGVPIRVVAVNHDTSVGQIEKNYSQYIGDHTDAITRRALLDLKPTGDNIAPFPSRAAG